MHKLITFNNFFHNTSTKVRPGPKSVEDMKRIKRKLCSFKNCKCSGPTGTKNGDDPKQKGIENGYVIEKLSGPRQVLSFEVVSYE